MAARTLPLAWACRSISPSQARRTPLLLTGLDGRSSIIGPSTLPYIQVSSANTNFASDAEAPSITPSIIGGKSSTHLLKGGIPQWYTTSAPRQTSRILSGSVASPFLTSIPSGTSTRPLRLTARTRFPLETSSRTTSRPVAPLAPTTTCSAFVPDINLSFLPAIYTVAVASISQHPVLLAAVFDLRAASGALRSSTSEPQAGQWNTRGGNSSFRGERTRTRTHPRPPVRPQSDNGTPASSRIRSRCTKHTARNRDRRD